MSRKRAWNSTPEGTGLRFELDPPGFVAFYKVASWLLVVGQAMVVPFSLLGIFGALVFDDFGLGMRIGMGIAGVGAAGAVVWATQWVLVGALAVRSRVTVTPGGILVETGVTSAREHAWLTPLSALSLDTSKTPERGGVVMTAGDRSIHVAVGYDRWDLESLVKAVKSALEEVGESAKTRPNDPPELKPLGPSWSVRLRRLAVDITAPLRHPTPYLLVDVGAIVGTFALTRLLDELVDWRDAYPIAFALFVAGLAARRYDGTYVAGLRQYLRDNGAWSVRYTLAGIGIALAGAAGMAPRLGLVPALVLATLTSIGLHWAMLRRARGDVAPKSHRTLDFVLALSLVPISILHEAAMFEFIVGSTADLAAFSLAFVPVVVVLAYLPIRLHAFVDNPGDRSNVAWFWITAIWLALGPVIATLTAMVREF